MNKIFSAIISSPLKGRLGGVLFALLATTTLWAYDFESGGFDYTITSNSKPYTVAVSGYYKTYSGHMQIPSSVVHNGITYSVTSIKDDAFNSEKCQNLTSVTIPNSVITIGRSAFLGCESLVSVNIGDNVEVIDMFAFAACHSLTSICIPDNVKTIKDRAFTECASLKSLTIGKSVTQIGNLSFSQNSLETITCKAIQVPSITSTTFSYVPCSSATLYVLPSLLDQYKTTNGWNKFGNILPIDGIVEDTYSITVTCNPEEGTVSGGGVYQAGATATLTATPKDGYEFVRWSDSNTANPRTLTVTKDLSLNAEFAKTNNPEICGIQRIWAYDLNLEASSGGNPCYKFTFVSTANATAANLVFLKSDGTEVGKVALETVIKGENIVELTLDMIPGQGKLNWGVELTAEPITKVTELTDESVDVFHFYYPQSVAINNNPESAHFGKIYVANPLVGTDGFCEYTSTQTRGIYVFDPLLNLENEPGVGYLPLSYYLSNSWDAIHRIAVDPKDGTIAFAKWDMEPFTVCAVSPDSLNPEVWWEYVEDLTPSLNQPVALCYDYEGTLCVLCYDAKGATSSIYSIYKVHADGTTEAVFTKEGWIVGGRSSIAADGQGGYWVVTNAISYADPTAKLMHIGKDGIDFEVSSGTDTLGLPANFNRGQLAYDMKRDVLAVGGGGKVTLYNVTYDAKTSAPLMEKWIETPMFDPAKPAWNTDGIAFDYAGDMVVMSASNERLYKFTMPIDNNTCTTPAPRQQLIVKDAAAVYDFIVAASKVRKVIVNGQLLILRDGVEYNVMGQKF